MADYLFLQCGQTFGSDFSPTNWEVIRQIWCVLAEALFTDNTLQTKHRHYLDRLQWCHSLTGRCSNTFSVAVADSINTGILDAQGLPVPTPHHVFVDDDICLDILIQCELKRPYQQVFMLSLFSPENLIWTFNRSLCYGIYLRRWSFSPTTRVLGLILNTCNMIISILDDFVASLNTLLKTTWGPHRK